MKYQGLFFTKRRIALNLSSTAVEICAYGLETKLEYVRGAACLKFNVRNCGDVVNAFMQNLQKKEHLQIA